ncbi:MAG: cytochrome c [Myxococcaceae bacterium]|nr:cytochrome c [Myxococcaceae bacterium]
MRWPWLLLLLSCAHAPRGRPDAALVFERFGQPVTTLDVAALERLTSRVTFRVADPYYQRDKGFVALELAPILRAAFGSDVANSDGELQLTAADGYTVLLPLTKAFEPGAHLAIADADGPWEPIGPQRANPGPFYLVWRGPDQQRLETHPRPWGLAKVSLVRFEDVYAWTVPPRRSAAIDDGYRLFRAHCLRCHAINRQGGRVGPELNVPQNVTEYRPREQLEAWVKNPLAFRYGNMPPFPNLTETEVDALLEYLTVMKERKHDEGSAHGH